MRRTLIDAGVDSVRKGKPFSAEGFLRASTGPLSPYFRGIIPDANGLGRLDPDRLKASWREDVTRIADHYGFNQDQRTKADAELKNSEHFADVWFHDRENAEKRLKYYHDLAAVQKRRLFPARATQAAQVFVQNRIIAPTLASGGTFKVPFVLRLMQWLPFLRRVPARVIAMGVRPEHVRTPNF